MNSIDIALNEFSKSHRISQKGFLCVGLVISRTAQSMEFPLKENDFLAESQGQVKGLGKGAVQRILNDHGITKVLAEEGGRTNRGSVGNMQKYVSFLNSIYNHADFDLKRIEGWWVERVNDFFKGKPFKMKVDTSHSLRSLVRDVLSQAETRQQSAGGTSYVGAVMQHLVGAKLELYLGEDLEHHGFSVADTSTDRNGDFQIDHVVIHVTRTPTEALIRKCKENLANGLIPLIVTSYKGAIVADANAESAGIGQRIDIFEIEQFIATNIYEISRFDHETRRVTVEQLVEKYNAIVDAHETDPSLLLVIG
ncbi:MAG: DUF4928 family protein [Kiritimatiellales bacterium]|nr:DUF4928 family protein [Kiritimatiellales bacterium]